MKTHDVIDNLCEDLQPVQPLAPPVRRSLYWFLASTAFVSALIFWKGVRPDFAQVSADLNFWVETVAAAVVAIIAITGAFVLSVPGTQSKLVRWFVAIPIFLWALQMGIRYYLTADNGVFSMGGAACSGSLAMVSAAPAIFLLVFMRRARPVLLGWTGALALIGIGSLGALVMQFRCPMGMVNHVFYWHFLPVLLLGALGIVLGRKLLRW